VTICWALPLTACSCVAAWRRSAGAPSAAAAPPVQPQPAVAQPQQQQPAPQPVLVVPRNWREVFAAIRAGNWAGARAGIAALPPSPLTAVAKAELYTAKGSPVVELPQLQALLAEAPDLPNADQIARMALTRGATSPPLVMPKRPVVSLGSAPGPLPPEAGQAVSPWRTRSARSSSR
jgi:soluble lytic murein transglycosylase